MYTSVNRVIFLLKREYLFEGLDDTQLAQVVRRFERAQFRPNHVLQRQGELTEYFFFVVQGKVRVMDENRSGDRPVMILGPGQFFGETSLLLNQPSPYSFLTADNVEVMRLEPGAFFALLQEFPKIRANLSATAQSRALVRRQKFKWLGQDEVIYYVTRRHVFFLYLSLILPALFLFLSIPTLVYAFTQPLGTLLFNLVGIFGVFLFGASFAWLVWNWLDWENDYYIVTNQRVIWLEKIIALYESRNEAPLDTVLAVNVSSSQLGRILDYGNVNVRTFTGGILMRNVYRPNLFASYVEGFRQRAMAISREEEIHSMEESLEQALRQGVRAIQATPQFPPLAITKPKPPKKPSRPTLREQLSTFAKVRYEKDGVVTYRKHWWLLVRKAWLPVILMSIQVVSWLFMVYLHYYEGVAWFTELPLALATGLFFFVTLLWLGYYFWDWTNDIYRLTREQVLDIERKPLGQEMKKSANLENILSIEHERANLLGIMLNFGDVVINVGETRFTFIGVYNPDQVHNDIADYREALIRRKRTEEAKREQERMVHWLVTFYEQTEKIERDGKPEEDDGISG